MFFFIASLSENLFFYLFSHLIVIATHIIVGLDYAFNEHVVMQSNNQSVVRHTKKDYG